MILSCGEALIDMLPRQSTEGEAAFAPYAGGAVFNTAIALGRLGVPSGFLSGVSTDLFGEVLTDTLAASKVDTSLLIRSGRPTTLAFVKLVAGQASYAFYDENTAGRMIAPADLPAIPASVSAMFFGGKWYTLDVGAKADIYGIAGAAAGLSALCRGVGVRRRRRGAVRRDPSRSEEATCPD